MIDWEAAGLSHPFYDLATLAMFLQLEDSAAHALLAAQEQRSIEEHELASFAAQRQLVALLSGFNFLSLLPELQSLPASAPTLTELYGQLRAGTLDLQKASGQAAFALALLQLGTAETDSGLARHESRAG